MPLLLLNLVPLLVRSWNHPLLLCPFEGQLVARLWCEAVLTARGMGQCSWVSEPRSFHGDASRHGQGLPLPAPQGPLPGP